MGQTILSVTMSTQSAMFSKMTQDWSDAYGSSAERKPVQAHCT